MDIDIVHYIKKFFSTLLFIIGILFAFVGLIIFSILAIPLILGILVIYFSYVVYKDEMIKCEDVEEGQFEVFCEMDDGNTDAMKFG